MSIIAITGANGFIGAATVEALAKRGDEVIAFDMAIGNTLKKLQKTYPNIRLVPGEITEWQHVAQLLNTSKPDAVIHCAAIVGPIASVESPFATMRVNIGGTLNVLESMRLAGVKRLIHLSSEEVYGDFSAERIDEEHPCRPQLPYGISKFAAEQLSKDYKLAYGMEIINVRTCWVYGPGLPRSRPPKNFIDAAINKTKIDLPHGGDFRVDHTYIDDLVNGLLAILDKPDHRYDTYNIASGRATSLSEIVNIIKSLVPDAQISIGTGPLQDNKIHVVRKGALNIERAAEELGYVPEYTIEKGLKAYLEAAR